MEPVITGKWFDTIPNDAIGIAATNNNNPLLYLGSMNATFLMRISEKNDNLIKMTQDEAHSHGGSVYLGAIVSADRQTIYWVNTTQPLP